jgi:hypothetical protein
MSRQAKAPLRSLARAASVFPIVVGPPDCGVSKMKLARGGQPRLRLRASQTLSCEAKRRQARPNDFLGSFEDRSKVGEEATRTSRPYSLRLFRQQTKLFARHLRPMKCLPFFWRVK